MVKNANDRVNVLLDKRDAKEIQMAKTKEQREYELMIRKEVELIKREERLENVERIARANEHKKKLIMKKIEYQSIRGDQKIKEKRDMHQMRIDLRKQAEKQKLEIIAQVEDMKKKGTLDKQALAKLGIGVDDDDHLES